jgi:hypothetical protein
MLRTSIAPEKPSNPGEESQVRLFLGVVMVVAGMMMSMTTMRMLKVLFLFLLLYHQLFLLLLECVDIGIHQHPFSAISARKAFEEWLGIYLGTRHVQHRWRSDEQVWRRSKRVDCLHLIDRRPMLPSH